MGAKAEDEKTFSVDYPEDFSARGLAARCRIHRQSKRRAHQGTAEIDDEWAQSLGDDIESVDQLRQKFARTLKRRLRTRLKEEYAPTAAPAGRGERV
jgi:FKBP-type peptidyl-prolyl cis-trans isomerase (trigger factor)